MNNLTILIEGYAYENEDGSWNASPTSVLIESKGKKILADPGANKALLLEKLEEQGLAPKDIDIVFLSHYHPDHFLNIRLFPDHAIYDSVTKYESDLESFFEDTLPGTDVKIIPTPGHSPEHTSLRLEVDGEIYVVAQDVFWWLDGEQKSDTEEDLMSLEDPFVNDKKALQESRKRVLEIADWIIPGHGKMFKNPLRSK